MATDKKWDVDQEMASFNLEKRDFPSSAATIAGLRRGSSAWSISEDTESKARVKMTTPNANSLDGKLRGREGR